MKKLGLLLCLTMVLVVLGGSALAQNVGDNSIYFVTYYSNANTEGAPDAVLRIVNDGDNSTKEVEGVPNGNLWASIYVFDDSQELQECCSCFVSADGLLSEDVNSNLTGNELTGRAERTRGVIKVVSSSNNDPTNNVLKAGLRAWATHIQAANSAPQTQPNRGPFSITEAALADSNLVSAEQQALQQSCSFAITLGSGFGVCSCTPEDHDF
jgi:hypothetical protein